MISSRHSSDHLPSELIADARSFFDRVSPRGSPIRYHDLAVRWPEYRSENSNFPPTFLDCLRRVTPPNGMLTFERFCAGLRLALAEERESQGGGGANGGAQSSMMMIGRQQMLAGNTNLNLQQQQPIGSVGNTNYQKKSPAPMPPTRSEESAMKTRQLRNFYGSSQSVTNGQYQNGHQQPQYPPPYNAALSRSRLNLDRDHNEQKNLASMKLNALLVRSTPQLYHGPAASGQQQPSGHQNGFANGQPNGHQLGQLNGHSNAYPNGHHQHPKNGHPQVPPQLNNVPFQNGHPKTAHHQPIGQRNGSRPSSVQSTDTNGSLEGIKFREKSAGPSISSSVATTTTVNPPHSQSQQQQPVVVMMRQKNGSRGPKAVASDTRRHTMMEGAESSSSQSKHIRLMQEEKELLKKATDTAHRLHNWYNERLSNLETREKFIGKSMIPVDYAVHEEKLNYLRAHITEVNRRAVALMESSDKGFPWHMNLELHRNIPQPADDQLMWMKRQNKMLTDEVSEKSGRLAQLETENTRLVKQLCESPNYKPTIHQTHQSSPPQQTNQNFHNANPSGTDSGFHSLTHQQQSTAIHGGPPLPPPNGQLHPQARGAQQQQSQRQYPSPNSVVYATPHSNNNNNNSPQHHQHQDHLMLRYREPVAPAPPASATRVYAELHKPPATERHNGILATLM